MFLIFSLLIVSNFYFLHKDKMTNVSGRFFLLDRVYAQTQPPKQSQTRHMANSDMNIRNSLQFDVQRVSDNSATTEQVTLLQSNGVRNRTSGLFGSRLQRFSLSNVSNSKAVMSPLNATFSKNTTLFENSSLLKNETLQTNSTLPESTSTLDIAPWSEIINLSHESLVDLNNSYSFDTHLANNTKICGFIGYCNNSAPETCSSTPINSCEDCSQVGAAFFLFIVVMMGLAILLGNSIVIAVGVHRHRKGKANTMDICRSSLAVADFFTGIQILVVTLYNYVWSTSLTGMELDREQLMLRGSVQAHFGATLYLFGYTSSLYHLSYIGLQRLYAIKKPFHYKWQNKRNVSISLGIVWTLSLALATVSAWLPHLTSAYIASGFLYLPTVREIQPNQSYTPIIALFVIFYCFPYITMTIITAAGAVLIRWNCLKKNQQQKERCKYEGHVNSSQQNVTALKTVAIMQLGFTVTLVPSLTIALLYYWEILDCSNVSTPYLVCEYTAMSHSFINVIVYSLRNRTFRSSLRDILSDSFPCCKRTSASSISNRSPIKPQNKQAIGDLS